MGTSVGAKDEAFCVGLEVKGDKVGEPLGKVVGSSVGPGEVGKALGDVVRTGVKDGAPVGAELLNSCCGWLLGEVVARIGGDTTEADVGVGADEAAGIG